ncbi:baeRF7 domain-containing protein [Lentisalinibacter orientalis]|uniref:baeRF7 domain-containing protein n=1 Tax=Lentisalinibacter orientalis TaxID=2992241 RepID=UPI00386E12B9
MTDKRITGTDDGTLREIAADRGETPHVTVVVPSTALPSERQENEIRLKNAIAEADAQLQTLGLDDRRRGAVLGPLIEARDGGTFWPEEPLDGGLAAYTTGSGLTRITLPQRPRELTVVGWRFHLKPVLQAKSLTGPFALLAISQNDVRLFEGDYDGHLDHHSDRRGLRQLDLAGRAPRSLEESAGRDLTEPNLQHHAGHRGSSEAIYHTHGGGKDDVTPELKRFLREVDSAVQDFLPHREAPLVLAGVESLLALYRQVSDLPAILEDDLHGNVEHLSAAELHERARELMERHQLRDDRNAAAALADAVGSGSATDSIDKALLATLEGRVSEIVVAGDREDWGYVDEGAHEVRHRDELPREDLLDRAAVETWLHGGRVRVLPAEALPGERLVCASLRY